LRAVRLLILDAVRNAEAREFETFLRERERNSSRNFGAKCAPNRGGSSGCSRHWRTRRGPGDQRRAASAAGVPLNAFQRGDVVKARPADPETIHRTRIAQTFCTVNCCSRSCRRPRAGCALHTWQTRGRHPDTEVLLARWNGR
jgi:hypothetical protein